LKFGALELILRCEQKKERMKRLKMIKNVELEKMLEEKGRQYVLTMYINRIICMTEKQLDYVLDWKEKEKNGR
jgi:hypothetical protein